MNIELRAIRKDAFDDVLSTVINGFKANHNIDVDPEFLTKNSEPLIPSKQVNVDFDIDTYQTIADDANKWGYIKLAETGMMLHKDLSSVPDIPYYRLNDKEFWAYLSLTSFSPIIKSLRSLDGEKVTEDKIKRFYFNTGTVSRTGLLFLWSMIDKLRSQDDHDISVTAFEFIDPVKAIMERTMSKNPDILRAYVDGIIKNQKNKLFKRPPYRTKVPNNISCYAAINILDAYGYDELVEVIAEQQKQVLQTTYK